MKETLNRKAATAAFALDDTAYPFFHRLAAPDPHSAIVGPAPQEVAPTLANSGENATFTEAVDDAPDPVVAIAPQITVGDVDSATLASATIIFTNGYHSDQDSLAFVNDNASLYGNIAAVFDSMTGTMSLTSSGASATKAQWQNALRHVTYTNPSDTPSTAQRRVSVTISDGTDTSAPVFVKFDVHAANDSPTGTDQTFTIAEDTVVVIHQSTLGYSDPDNNALDKVSFQSWDGGTLYIDEDGAGSGEPEVVRLNFAYFASELSSGHVYFVPDFESSGIGAAHITFTVMDRGGDPFHDTPDPTPNTVTFDITPVLDTPEATALDGDYATYVVGGDPAYVDLGHNSVVTDDDSADLGGGFLTVQLTNSAGAEDVLGFDVSVDSGVTLSDGTNVGSIVSVDGVAIGTISSDGVGSDPLTVQFNDDATPAAVTILVHALTYADSSPTPTLGQRDISITISDGDNLTPPPFITHMTVANSDATAIAQPDFFTTHESHLLQGNVFDDNGSGLGPDSDPDSPMVTVETINGLTGVVGTEIELPSGALLTLNADGTFTYDPRAAFDPLAWAGSGDAVTTADDSFTYMLANGTETTVSIHIIGDDTNDHIDGTAGADNLKGGNGNDFIDGGAGNDNELNGGTGNDFIDGGTGADVMVGGEGDDSYVVDNPGDNPVERTDHNEGNDTVYTSIDFGLGNTWVETLRALDPDSTVGLMLGGNQFDNTLIGAEGNDFLLDDIGNDTLEGHGGNDLLISGNGNDFIDGGEGNDAIYGGQGNDVLVGGGGDDYIVGGAGVDGMYGGDGNDTYFLEDAGDFAIEAAGEGQDIAYAYTTHFLPAGSEIEILAAVDNADTIAMDLYGNELDNQLWGNAGVNYLAGGDGADVLIGYGGNDTLVGDDGNDYADGGAGADSINGGAGADFLIGGDGDDYVDGGTGNDLLIGGIGNDFLVGGTGGDGMYGGAGNDTYIFDDASDYAIENAGEGTDAIYTSVSYSLTPGSEIEILSASATNTTNAMNLFGNALANQIWGNDGANYLDGGAGNDYLAGNGGDDLLIGGTGNDTLAGGGGADSFAFTSALNAATNVDIILDFSSADDTIVLDHSVFAGLTGGPLAAGAFVIGSAALDADDRIIYNSATGAIFFDADGSGAGAAVQFATVAAGTTLTASDFYVV